MSYLCRDRHHQVKLIPRHVMSSNSEENSELKPSSKNTGEIIYNITLKVERGIEQVWLQWLIDDYAPGIITTNCFTKFTLLKLLEFDDAEGSTYALQFSTASLEDYERYRKNFAEDFQEKAFSRWQQKMISFGTVMQVVV